MKEIQPKQKNSRKERTDGLRREAEKLLPKKRENLKKTPAEDMEKLVHELEVHQIELEMQNEELRKAQIETEESRTKYVEIYDFAPVGYFTLNSKGMIVEANLAGAAMLGIERSLLLRKPFFRLSNHVYAYSVLNASQGVEILNLGYDCCIQALCNSIQSDQRRIANGLGEIFVDLSHNQPLLFMKSLLFSVIFP